MWRKEYRIVYYSWEFDTLQSFYRDLLRLPQMYGWYTSPVDRGCKFKIGDNRLELICRHPTLPQAGRVGIGAGGAAAAGPRAHGQHRVAAIPLRQRAGQSGEPFLVAFFRAHHGLVVEVIGHGAHRLHQHTVAVVRHAAGHVLQ